MNDEKIMTEISQSEAIQAMDKNDFAIWEEELHLLKSSNYQDKEQIERYFTDGDMIYLKVYWNGEHVQTISFTNNAEENEQEVGNMPKKFRELRYLNETMKMTISEYDEFGYSTVNAKELIISVLDIVGEILSNKKSLISAATDKKAQLKNIHDLL